MANLGKRQRVDSDADVDADEQLAEARDLRVDLEALYGNMPEEDLWDTSKCQTLVQPTACYSHDSSREYRYIGREKAKDLLEELLSLERGSMLQIQGAKGSGKSTVVSSLAGYMLGKRKRKLVYICASRFIGDPVPVLLHALLVAYDECDERLCRLTAMEELHRWCSIRRRDRLLFVVDEWDKFEGFPDAEKALVSVVSYYHILVKLSSANSRERTIFAASDKPPRTFDLDGPYTHEELQTWIGQSSLPKGKLGALDCLTGGMPRLLRFYEEVKGKRRQFMQKIEVPYTSKLFHKLVGLQTTKAQLASAIEMVTTGVRGIHLRQPVDLTCFYKEGHRFKLLSPYLRCRAEDFIMEQEKVLESGLAYGAVQTWAGAVRMDCLARGGRNPARAGWNVEGLVIAVMRYQGKLWSEGLPFMHYKTYEHGLEAALLGTLQGEELSAGVLVGPVAFNERAVDVIHLKLNLGTLTITAVQITISKWKNKRRKRSHKVWQEEVLPRWLSQKWNLEHQFIYVMPEKVDAKELGAPDTLMSYIADCHAPAASSSTDEEDEDEEDGSKDTYFNAQYGEEQYEGVNITQVTNLPVEFKKLGDVHHCLAEFDKLLDLPEPAKLDKKQVVQCGGVVRENGIERACARWSRTENEVYYCCSAHNPNSSTGQPAA